MATDKATGMTTDDKPKANEKRKTGEFPIRPLDDLRRFRDRYPRGANAAPGPDGSDAGEDEVDFGLKRSTPEEAWQFYLDSLKPNAGDDELTEFLNDG